MVPIRVVVASYGSQIRHLEEIRGTLPKNVDLVILDKILEDMAAVACEMEKTSSVDVFVASGGNGDLLERYARAPVVKIAVTGTDILAAVREAARHASRVAVISYGTVLPVTRIVADLAGMEIREFAYGNVDDLHERLDNLKRDGINDVIAGSLAQECAERRNMRTYAILGRDGVQQAIHAAINLALANKKEKDISRRLASIVHFAREGIIATDRNDRIVEFNPRAEKLSGLGREFVIGRKVQEIIPNSRLHVVTAKNKAELNSVQNMGNTRVLTNRIPIVSDGEVIGGLATFQSVDVVEEAENTIRRNLQAKGFAAKTRFDDIVGDSTEIRQAKKTAYRYSFSDSTVLIRGESGTGKELFAQSIHNAGNRADKPFVAVNCAAFSSTLLESELFGYDSGAFTGARKQGKKGVFELANGGTIFLDEIAEISLDTQTKLLRVLEQREVMRLGGDELLPVDIRVIAATNKNIWQMVQEDRFRTDLFYRLNVLEVKIAPLRARPRDIPVLLAHFLERICPELEEGERRRLAGDPTLLAHQWPGNAREMRNLVERFSVLRGDGSGVSRIGDLLPDWAGVPALRPVEAGWPRRPDRGAVVQALEECGGNKTAAAKKLGMCRTTLWRKIREYGLAGA